MRTSSRVVLGAAAGVALVTIAARVVGFGRTAVLARTVGATCVGDTYQIANYVPNVMFEVVAGGALASLVVPVLAVAAASGDRATTSRTASALLSWTVVLLVPVAVLGALLAPQILRVIYGEDPTCAGAVETGSRMLVVFMPQVVLYGIAVVLVGVIQAHRRFLGPALAPLLSSVVVIAAYLAYAARGAVTDLDELSRGSELVLSVGTTLGVAVLSLGLLVPLRGCGVRLRPTWSFPPGVAARIRRLAGSGMAGLVAQQLALLVALRLLGTGSRGSVIVFATATALFLLPWSVLAVPLATTAFPGLTTSAETGDTAGYAAQASRSLRSLLLAMTGAAAVLAVVAAPVAGLLVRGAPGAESSAALADATVAFAPGLVGYGLVALLSRALYARGDARTPAVAIVLGWLVVAVTDVVLVATVPDVERVVLLGLGNTAGMTLAGLLLLLGLGRASGGPAFTGAARSGAVGLLGALSAYAVGALVPLPDPGPWADLSGAAGTAVLAGFVFLGVVRLLDPDGLRGLLRA